MTRIAFALASVVLVLGSPIVAQAQTAGRVTGTVTDESGGVLPGVSVVVSARDGRVLGTTTTDAVGAYTLDGLPIIPVRLTFQLDGFSTGATDVPLSANGTVQLKQRLSIAVQTEDVTVVGKVPPPPAPPAAIIPPPPPAPITVPVVEHARESVCGPTKLTAAADTYGTIRAKRFGAENGLYFAGDQLTVDRGTADGLAVFQNFVARRTFRTPAGSPVPMAEHSAGLVQVVAATEHSAFIVVIYACDEVMRGDTLAAFKPELVVPAEPAGVPAFDDPSRLLFADEGQFMAVPNRLVVIDRGLDRAVRPGQRFSLFRPSKIGRGKPIVLGDAVVVSVRQDSATIRIEHAIDAITFSDLAAPQRSTTATTTARRPG